MTRVLSIFSALFLAAINPAGTWVADVPSASGRSLLHTFVLTVDGNNLAGTVSFGREKGVPLIKASSDGQTITFTVRYQAVNGTVDRLYRGNMHDDSIDFNISDPQGTVSTTARRVR